LACSMAPSASCPGCAQRGTRMASPASIHTSPRRRWFASSRSRSARGLHSAGREAALPSARERQVRPPGRGAPPPEHRGRILFPKKSGFGVPHGCDGGPRSTGPGSNWVKTWGWAFLFRDAAGKSQDATGAGETVCSLVGSDGNSVNSSIVSMHRQGIGPFV